MIQKIQLPLQTANLITGFMVWVIISSLLPYIRDDIALTDDQIAIVTAIPVILGSLLRVPLGYLANIYGARIVFLISFVLLLFPVFYISVANSFIDLIVGGLFLGLGGAVFSVGVTSLPKYYSREKHGFVNGIYGVGNLGTALTSFAAPVIANHVGWQLTVKFYLILLLAFIVINVFIGDRKEKSVRTPIIEQMKGVYKDERLWFLSLFYFITFGSFVAFTIYLPNFLVSHFGLDKVDAGFRTAGFIVLCTLVRPVGGWLADRFNSLILLMYVFAGLTISAIVLSFAPSIGIYTVGCLSIAALGGIGNGVIFKLVPMYFNKQAGIVNGIVSAFGGLGGFFPPLLLTLLFSVTGHYAIGFMALSEVALASFIIVVWMYYQDRIKLSDTIIESTPQGLMVTDLNGVITSVNPGFTKMTGFEKEEAIGKKPSILKSGKQSEEFYKQMWETLRSEGYWQGTIWNRKKNGELFHEWLTITAIKTDSGETKYYAGMFSDITDHS